MFQLLMREQSVSTMFCDIITPRCLVSMLFLFTFSNECLGHVGLDSWINNIADKLQVFINQNAHLLNADCQHGDDDICRNVSELITSKGYPCEEYSVTTDDGFILGLQRIPTGRNGCSTAHDCNTQRPVVFLQHGLLDSASTWVINSANQSLGYMLADAGFDVWLGNMRGNTYSKHHTTFKPTDEQFWAWSWDEMANSDLPAMLNFILSTTGQSQLSYIGHSQGTLIAFARLSHDPRLANRVKAFIALGPVATVGHIKGAISLLVDIAPEAALLFKLFGVHDFLPSDDIIKVLATTLCRNVVTRYVCENVLFLITGYDTSQLNVSRLPVYFSHTPAGTSVQNMVHFAQMVKSKCFQMYDYGSVDLNFKHYNQSTPPLYNVSAMTTPTYIFSGGNDWLADPTDVDKLVSKLINLKFHERIASWEHLDFIWAENAANIIYNNIIKILQQTL